MLLRIHHTASVAHAAGVQQNWRKKTCGAYNAFWRGVEYFDSYKTLTVHSRRNVVRKITCESTLSHYARILRYKLAGHRVRGLRVAYRVPNTLKMIHVRPTWYILVSLKHDNDVLWYIGWVSKQWTDVAIYSLIQINSYLQIQINKCISKLCIRIGWKANM